MPNEYFVANVISFDATVIGCSEGIGYQNIIIEHAQHFLSSASFIADIN